MQLTFRGHTLARVQLQHENTIKEFLRRMSLIIEVVVLQMANLG
jgi:hypothetical protein